MATPMSSAPPQEDERLREQISDAQEKLSGLDRNLREIDAELEALAEQRARYDALSQACASLEELDQLGAAELFWGEDAGERAAGHLRAARGRIGAFEDQIGQIEARRNAVLEEIAEGRRVLDILEDDLFELQEEEEARKQEWVPERELGDLPMRQSVMPWARVGEDDSRFRRSLAATLLVSLLLGLLFPWVDLPLPDFETIPDVPDRMARLIEPEPLPPPAPPEPVAEEEPVEEEEPEPVEEEPEEAPEPEAEPVPAEEQPAAPEREIEQAGILAFRQNFSSLAESRPSAELGSRARINDAGESAVGRTERSMVTTDEPGSSGGINLSSLSRDVGGEGGPGGQIEGVQVSRVASSIGGSGPSDRPRSSGAAAGRTDEEIQIVFDRYKAALYRLYNRQLRNDPTLRGQVVLQLTIEPNGSVSFCDVQSSDMDAPVLEQQVVDRVLGFDFGAKDVPAITILYPIDFLPAG